MKGKKTAVLSASMVVVVAALVLALALGGCSGGVSGKVTASGSTTVLPLAQAAADQFMKKNSGATVTVQGGGSTVGITQVSQGAVNIGDSSRELKPEEQNKGLEDNKIAYDIIVMIVNKNVPVTNLTTDQAKGIFTGSIKNWNQVGGPDAPIVVVVRDSASGTRELFDEKVLGKTSTNPVSPVAGAQETNSNGIMRQTVGSTQNSIGYISYGYLDSSVKAVQLNGVTGNLTNALNKTYPLGRYLHMFTKGTPTGATKSYIDFVLSDDFQNNTVSKEYIPLTKVPSSTQ
jgi:phosphate transport system substrate-binding protein